MTCWKSFLFYKKKQKSLAFSEIFSFQCFAGIDRKFKKDETDILLPAQCRLGQSTQRRVECSTTAAQSFLVTFLVTFLEMLPAAAPVLAQGKTPRSGKHVPTLHAASYEPLEAWHASRAQPLATAAVPHVSVEALRANMNAFFAPRAPTMA